MTATPQTKTEQARAAFARADYKAAFAIFKGFGKLFAPRDLRTLQIAHESLTGKAGFYNSLGIDTDDEIAKAKTLIQLKYNL